MIRKISIITSQILWVLAVLYNIFVEYVPNDLIEYINSIYPEQPYEMYILVIGLLVLWTNCFLIYKNSKYAIPSVVLTLITTYLPYMFIAGIDANNNVASNLIELSDLSYGIAVGALLIENKTFTKNRKRKINK